MTDTQAADTPAADNQPSDAPLFTVVRGEPTPEELAALTAVVLAAADGEATDQESASPWAARSATIRRPLDHGPGAWRASGLPH